MVTYGVEKKEKRKKRNRVEHKKNEVDVVRIYELMLFHSLFKEKQKMDGWNSMQIVVQLEEGNLEMC